jgi:hypothetical protein
MPISSGTLTSHILAVWMVLMRGRPVTDGSPPGDCSNFVFPSQPSTDLLTASYWRVLSTTAGQSEKWAAAAGKCDLGFIQ